MSERRKLAFTGFDQVIRDVEALKESGYEKCGAWSLAQVCEHLSLFLTGAIKGFPIRLPPGAFIVQAYFRWRFLPKILATKRMKRGVQVPQQFLPADTSADDAAWIERLKTSIAQFESHTGDYQRSPLFGKLSPDQWRDLQLIHCSHHLSFLRPKS